MVYRLACAVALGLAGCQNCELVETELRYQTERAENFERLLLLRDAEICTLKATVETFKPIGPTPVPTVTPPEEVQRMTGVSKVEIGPSSAGRDLDEDGIDDAISLIVIPRDQDNDPFKCPGEVTVVVTEATDSGALRPVAEGSVDQESLRRAWRTSLLSSGYEIIVPWSSAPTRDQLTAAVKWTTLDGRVFEATRAVTIRRVKTTAACPLPPEASPALLIRPHVPDAPPVRIPTERPVIVTSHKPVSNASVSSAGLVSLGKPRPLASSR